MDEEIDNFSRFIRRAARHELLTAAEEINFIKQLDAAWPTRLTDNGHGIPPAARPIINELVEFNIRLVLKVVGAFSEAPVPREDLFSEGIIGLHRGICKFDLAAGVRLSTYVTNWISQRVRRAVVEQQSTIRRPVHFYDRDKRVAEVRAELESNGDAVEEEALAGRLGWDVSTVREFERLKQQSSCDDSLDSPILDGDGDGYDLESLQGPGPQEQIGVSAMVSALAAQLETLKPREEKILRLRFGVGDNEPQTLEEVGQKFGLTRERVRQIESEALRKLRHPRRSRYLREFL